MIGVLVRTGTRSFDERLAEIRRARRDLRLADHARLVDELEAASTPSTELDLVLAAERLRDIGYTAASDAELRDARERLRVLVDRTDDPALLGRLHGGLGQTHARLMEAGWGAAATDELRASARAHVRAGEPAEAAAVLAMLAWSVQLPTQGLRVAQRSLDEAIELTTDPATAARFLSQRAKLRVWLGDLAAAAEDVDTALGHDLDLDTTAHAYVAWSEVLVHAPLGDRDRVLRAHQRGEAHLAGWHDTVTGVQYDVEVADGLAHVGLVDEAWHLLARAQARREEDPDTVARGELMLHARVGDAATALEAWRAVSVGAAHEEWERGRLRLLAALAMERCGEDPAEAAGLAFEEVARRAGPEALLAVEPTAARELLPAAARHSAVARWLRRQHHGWHLDLLGAAELRGPDGEEVPVAGRVATLLAVLLDAEGPLPPERVAAEVWPEDDEDAGDPVARVRRLLHRVRGLAPVVERDADGRLRPADDLSSDLGDLRHAVSRARSADGEAARAPWLERAEAIAMGVSTEALLARDDLPPAIVHDVQRLLHWVHRAMADLHVDRARDDLARRHWGRALALVPDDDATAVALARSLIAEGRRADALDVVRATEGALAEIRLRPSATFQQFAATLHGDEA